MDDPTLDPTFGQASAAASDATEEATLSTAASAAVPPRALAPTARILEEEEFQRIASGQVDSGQVETLPDGAISIPVFEEVLVRHMIVKERIIVRKEIVSEQRRVGAELRKERVDVVPDPQVAALVDRGDLAAGPSEGQR